MTQPLLRDSRAHCRLAPGAPRTPTDTKAGPQPRADGLRSSAARRGLTAALRRPRPCEQPGAPGGAPAVAWSHHLERPGTLGKASSYPLWTAGEEAKDGDSSVSSGRLSGSSGGHNELCVPPHRPLTERPPQVLGSPRQHRERSPRLERLRDRIRAQARWQGSCASLGTSMPSSASHLHKASVPAPQQKVQKLKKPPAAPAYPVPQENPRNMKSSSCKREKPFTVSARKAAKDKESQLVGAHAWRKGQALARGLLGPPPPLPRLQSKAASRETAHHVEIGDTEKVGAARSHPVRPRTPSPAALHSYPQVPPSTPFQAPCDQAVTIQSALAILQDLRQQIQAGLELARDHQLRRGREQWPSPRWRQELAERRPQGPCRAPDLQGSFSKTPWVPVKGTHSSSERARSIPGQRWRTLARWESHPQRTWLAQGRDLAFQRPGSPHERPSCFPQRPWSASAGQRAWATCKGWEAPARGPWSPLERPSPPVQRPWSASLTKWAGSPCEGKCSRLPPSGARNAWLGPTQSTLRMAPGKDNEMQAPLPCPKTRGLLGRPYSPESLREFMRQKALVRRQQALEEKASAARALELRNRRLQDVYRKQREAVLGKAGPSKASPVVSQTTPSIVTFVPHSAQSWDLEAPGNPRSPVMQWSKVTSGMVLGDQEAPGSFCLCLNGALDGAEPLEPAGPQEGWEGTPPLRSASPSLGRLGLRDLATRHPCPGLCIYLDPEESERLGTPGPLHFRYKQARLQALETMANILKQRIDILTAKLLGSEAADAPRGLVPDLPPSCPSTVPTASTPATPACPRALVPNGGRGAPWDVPARPPLSPASFLEGEALLWSPGWEQRRAVSPRAHPSSQPRGFTEDRCSELDKRLARNTASFQALCTSAGSSPGVPAPPDPTCGSLWLEETPWARGAGSVTPWTLQSCGQPGQPGQPSARHLVDIQQKSLSFLQSLERHQQTREQALALLRRRAELEVWETRRALDELLFKHRLERLSGNHATQARLGAASELEGLQVCGDPDLKTSQSAVTARLRSQPPLGGDAALPSWGSKKGPGRWAGHSASAEPMEERRPDQALSQLLLARLYPGDSPIHQMLRQRLREQKLRAQHQAALLRLRKKALERKTRSELAWLEHRRRYLGSKGNVAGLAALAGQQRQALSNPEPEQREIRYPWDSHLSSHHERTLLLQHRQDILSVRRSLARLWQKLQATTQLLQSSGPQIPAPGDRDSETSQQLEGPVQGASRPPTPHRPGSPASHHPRGSPESPRVPPLVTEQQDGTPPRATSAVDGHLQPLRPAWGQETPTADGWPDAQGRLVESGSHMGQGDAQTNPWPCPAERETRALTEGHPQSFRGWSPHSPSREGPCSPQDASQAAEGGVGTRAGPDFAGSLEEEAPAMESQQPEEQRTETHWQEDPQGPSSWQEAAQLTTRPAPAVAEAVTSPTQHQGSPLPQLTAPSGTCSGSSLGSRSLSPVSDLSCPSFQEFRKVSAFLVQLSESSTSLSDWEAGDSPDADLGWSRGSSPRDSRGLHGDRGQAAWEKPSGSGTSPLHGPSTVSGGPELEPGLWQQGRTLLSRNVPSSRAGSGLSEASSEVWDQEGLLEPGTAQTATGCTSPAGGSDDLEDGGAPHAPLLSLGPGGGQEASGTSGSLTGGSDTGKANRASPEAARTAFPSDPSSCSDLDLSLSFPSGSSASKGAGSSKGVGPGPPQASAGRAEGPWAAGPRAPAAGKPPEPPPGAPCLPAALRAESWAPGPGGVGAAPVPEEAQPPPGSRVLQEILSPVDEVLSYGSADLPSCTHRDAHPPPLPPALPAERGATPSPHSEDFPSPPEDTLCSGGSLSPPEEGASINTCELSSLSEEGPPEAPSLEPQGASLCLGAGGQGRRPRDQLGESSSIGGNQAVGGQWSGPFDRLGSPSCGGAGDTPGGTPRLSVQCPALSHMDCAAGAGLLTPLVAGDTGLSGTWQGDPAPALDMGPCAGPPGVDRTQVVDLVSTQLTRRILCDTLAALSEMAPPGSPTGQRAGGSCVTRPPTVGLGSLGGDGTSEKPADNLQ